MIKTRNIKYTLVSVRFYFSSSTHWPLNPVAKHNCYTGISLCTSLWSQRIQIRHEHDTLWKYYTLHLMKRTLTKDSWIELKWWGWGCTPSQLIQFIEIAFCLLIFSQTQINFLANLYFTSTQENSRFLESFFISYRIDTTTELTTWNIQLRLTLLPTLQTKCNVVGNY